MKQRGQRSDGLYIDWTNLLEPVEIVPEAEPDREALAVVAVEPDAVDALEALSLDEDAPELVDDPEAEEVREALALALDEAVPVPWKEN